jgi:hypothetical protein
MCQVPIWFEGKFEFSSPVELLANLCARLRGTPARFEDVPHGRSHTILIADAPIYIPVVPELESRFRNTTSKLLAKHDLRVVGYWVPEGAPAWDNTFIFKVAHSSPEEAKKNWDAFRADPELQEVIQSAQANKTVEKIDVTYMRPTDFSPMK